MQHRKQLHQSINWILTELVQLLELIAILILTVFSDVIAILVFNGMKTQLNVKPRIH